MSGFKFFGKRRIRKNREVSDLQEMVLILIKKNTELEEQHKIAQNKLKLLRKNITNNRVIEQTSNLFRNSKYNSFGGKELVSNISFAPVCSLSKINRFYGDYCKYMKYPNNLNNEDIFHNNFKMLEYLFPVSTKVIKTWLKVKIEKESANYRILSNIQKNSFNINNEPQKIHHVLKLLLMFGFKKENFDKRNKIICERYKEVINELSHLRICECKRIDIEIYKKFNTYLTQGE